MAAPAVESRIEAVTVFSHGALVTRVASLPAPGQDAPRSLRVPGLPLALDDGSVRICVVAGAATARDLRITLEGPEREVGPSADERKLREALREESRLQAHVERLRAEAERAERLPFLGRPPGREGEAPGPSPAEARLALLEFQTRRSEQLAEELRRLRGELRKAAERRKEFQERVKRASNAGRLEAHEVRKTVVVSLDWPEGSEGAGSGSLQLDYVIPGARWAPAYSWRLNRGGAAELAMRAVVAQRTGEDWSDVALTLSTADAPRRWVELPELRSLRIGRRQPVPPARGWRPPPDGTAALYSDWDRSFGGQLREPAAPMPKVAPAATRGDTGELLAAPPEVALAAGAAHEDTELSLDTEAFAALEAAPAAPPTRPAAAPAKAMRAPAASRLSLPTGRGRPGARPPGAPAAAKPSPESREEGPLRARDEMLAYGSLRMPPARHRERGRLVVTQRVVLYTELLVEQKLELSFDLDRALEKAAARAHGAESALPSGLKPAASDEDGFDHAFAAEGRVTIPSDRSHHSVPVARHGGDAAIRHVCVPRESRDVFRVAAMDNPFPAPLLPGPVEVSLDGSFLLTSRVPATPRGGRLELGLGVDEGVRVARSARYREETQGLTRGRLALAHEIAIDVQNNSPDRVQLEVRERVPATGPDEKEIEVALGDVDPPWEAYEPEARGGEPRLRGGYRWKVAIDPGEKIALRAPYTIRISSKHELSGGNRRE